MSRNQKQNSVGASLTSHKLSVSLEPRLQEYLRRKAFNDANSINPDISEENEFGITPNDRKMLYYYKIGDIKSYRRLATKTFDDYVKPDVVEFGDEFKQDFRYKRIEKQTAAHKDAQTKIQDLSQMDPEYKIFHDQNPHVEKIDTPYVPPFETPDILDGRDFALGPSRSRQGSAMATHKNSRDDKFGEYRYNVNRKTSNPNSYNHPPKLAYRQYLQQPSEPNGNLQTTNVLTDMIGQLDDYGKYLNNATYLTDEYDKGGYADLDTHTYTPKVRDDTQRDTCNCYTTSFMYNGMMPDVTVEDALRGGITDSSKKSIGFKNMFENQFYYISNEITDPNHNVMMLPSATRGTSKILAKSRYK